MNRTIEIYLPKWVMILYSFMAIILIPWIFDLASNLPAKHVTRHWDTLWVGFDIAMLVVILATIFLMIKHAIWVIVSGTILATLFVVDAWFDVLTARSGGDQRKAIFFGIIEISLALLTYRIIYHAVRETTEENDVRLTGNQRVK